jgi:general secretion pathway protein H
MEPAVEKATIRTSSGSELGFSLIELMIVLVIVGIGASLVLPSLDKGFDSLQIRQTALGIAAVARSLRTRSMKEQIPFRLVVSSDDGSYQVFGQSRILFPKGVQVSVEGGEPVREGVRHFVFFPNGRMVGGEILVSSHDQGGAYTVRLDKISGKVLVMRSKPS